MFIVENFINTKNIIQRKISTLIPSPEITTVNRLNIFFLIFCINVYTVEKILHLQFCIFSIVLWTLPHCLKLFINTL